jgi:iron-sulfur cluster repair protein YtfE (RIC family)
MSEKDTQEQAELAPLAPSEVRRRILEDHAGLRESLSELEERARGCLGGGEPEQLVALREGGERFHEALSLHIRWEDQYLAPALRDADAWGDERVKRLEDEHREQRALLADHLARLRDPTREGSEVARDILLLGDLLRVDMDREEKQSLDPNVLRDDVVSVSAEAG